MFYSTQILAKKGPLGLVWIAAHLDRQLKRNQISEASIPASVDTLLEPEAPLALRLSGQLLLGVVRIYERKVKYLQQDANEALARVRASLKAHPNAAVDLPPGAETAPHNAITLPLLNGSGLGGIDGDWDDWTMEGQVVGAFGAGGDGVLQFQIGLPSGSGMLSQDVSEVFGMHFSTEDERFDTDGPLPFDLDELEVELLRDAPSQTPHTGGVVAPGDLLLRGADTPASVGKGPLLAPSPNHEQEQQQQHGEDMDMDYEPLLPIEPEPEAAAAAGAAAAGGLHRAGSPAPSSGGGWTPGSMGGGGLLEGLLPTPQALSVDQEEGPTQEDQAGEQQQGVSQEQDNTQEDSQAQQDQGQGAAAVPPRRSQRRANELAKAPRRKVVMDTEGTTLPAAEVRALLADRSSLVDRSRGKRKRARTTTAANEVTIVAGPAHGLNAMPAFAMTLAPELQTLFAAAMGRGPAVVAGGRGVGGRAAAAPALPDAAGAASPAAPSGGRGASPAERDIAGNAMEVDGADMMQQQEEEQQQEDDYEPLMLADHAEADQGPYTGGSHPSTPGSGSAGRSAGNDGDTPADNEPQRSGGSGRSAGAANAAAGGQGAEGSGADGGAGVQTPGSCGAARSGGAGGAVWEADAERLLEADADMREGEEECWRASDAGVDANGFTFRTRMVARELTSAAAAQAAAASGDAATANVTATPASASSGRSKRISAAAMAPFADVSPAQKLSLDGMVQGRSRLQAARFFYEVLALGNRGLVELLQQEPYGDVDIVPNGKALAAL